MKVPGPNPGGGFSFVEKDTEDPSEEQKEIIKKLDALSEQTKKLEGIYKQKLADLEELKKSMLKKAFNGELLVCVHYLVLYS